MVESEATTALKKKLSSYDKLAPATIEPTQPKESLPMTSAVDEERQVDPEKKISEAEPHKKAKDEAYSPDDLFGWAMSVPIEPVKRVGKYAIHCVLAVLVTWCDNKGNVYPGAQIIADRIDGCAKATVQLSLDALEDQEIITRVGKMGRAIKYHINVDLGY